MKFLVDAQLPRRLAVHLTELGHDAVHTLELPDQNRTSDDDICSVADAQNRIVVSKDSDFRDTHILDNTPSRLLHVATGNISNTELLALMDAYLEEILQAFDHSNHVELHLTALVVRHR
ncbi:hypothetical protein GIS00_25985 [Nakamurella sp. YIM 132087]|uniref:DUF5615 domain-containing protein n=1 Tax=Nakamurella alba TaxID=2665158 RepID=A0A7K1FTA2_9ACTN|nr:DUF5615 family PIN-like protein [Nakamurella alba]MTD17386.1 hypothetical protein [Nakamurella alba]